MGAVGGGGRNEEVTIGADQVGRILWESPRPQYAIVVVDRDQSSIEHPVQGSGQRQSVANRVGSGARYRFDMGSLYLWSAASVDELETADRAPVVVGEANLSPERFVAERPIKRRLDRRAFSVERNLFLGHAGQAGRI